MAVVSLQSTISRGETARPEPKATLLEGPPLSLLRTKDPSPDQGTAPSVIVGGADD